MPITSKWSAAYSKNTSEVFWTSTNNTWGKQANFRFRFIFTMHTVSFDWFLSGLEWIRVFELGVLLTETFDILPENIIEYQI